MIEYAYFHIAYLYQTPDSFIQYKLKVKKPLMENLLRYCRSPDRTDLWNDK